MTSYSGRPGQDPEPEGRPALQVACCLCRRVVPPAQEVLALDAEWQRRFPSMAGVLACEECVLEIEWKCQDEAGEYVPGHIPATGHGSQAQDVDSWSHLPAQGTQVSTVSEARTRPRDRRPRTTRVGWRHVRAEPSTWPSSARTCWG